ncbi:MAG: hypothetical protein M1828_004168 [Chrysothrix sp. TS-e1954]|nr:MAG: hypothetical protein M1828_004168 [Chrysothrix sp. TS-e1954]
MDIDDYSGDEATSDPKPTRLAGPSTQAGTPRRSRTSESPTSKRTVQHQLQVPKAPFNYFAKVDHYANTRLSPSLPPLKLYIPTYPLLNLAAHASLAVYDPQGQRHQTSGNTVHIPKSPLSFNTRHITLTTTPLSPSSSSSHTYIIIAIRGTSSTLDWASNLSSTPVAPQPWFLQDAGNLVHEGFLNIALASLKPLHQHINVLLSSPTLNGNKVSLCLTGHSAGGAVAALLYSHLISPSSAPALSSELRTISTTFKRIHCITFGSPPVSLLPLQKPSPSPLAMGAEARRSRKSVFLSFINEGDPVARADKAIFRSLVRCCAAATPRAGKKGRKPIWNVPPGTFSCAGRLVLLRDRQAEGYIQDSSKGKRKDREQRDKVEASVIEDEMLRGLLFGDLVAHSMRVYAERVEQLAVQAVVGGA